MLETIILLFSALLIGYLIGKYHGRIKGVEEGKSEAIIMLREKSFERGYCVLCCKAENCRQRIDSIGPDRSTYNKREEW